MDAAEDAIAAAEAELQEYLSTVAGQLGAKGKASFVALHKDSHVLEVSQVPPCVPACFSIPEVIAPCLPDLQVLTLLYRWSADTAPEMAGMLLKS